MCALPSRRDFRGETEKLMMNVITLVLEKIPVGRGETGSKARQEDTGLVINEPWL